MIARASWRRGDAVALDPAGGTEGGASVLLSATDAGSVTVLHLDPGGSTPRETDDFGQLVVVVAGSGAVEVGDESAPVRAGDAVRWPRGVPHRLTTDEGVSVLVATYPEERLAWKVSRTDGRGGRWVVGVFADTNRAKAYRDRLRDELPAGETAALE